MPPYERPIEPPDYTADELEQREREAKEEEYDRADQEIDDPPERFYDEPFYDEL